MNTPASDLLALFMFFFGATSVFRSRKRFGVITAFAPPQADLAGTALFFTA